MKSERHWTIASMMLSSISIFFSIFFAILWHISSVSIFEPLNNFYFFLIIMAFLGLFISLFAKKKGENDNYWLTALTVGVIAILITSAMFVFINTIGFG